MSDVKVCPQCGQQFDSGILFCPKDGSALRLVDSGASLVGQVIADRYHILRLLGQGGMGRVYLAEHVKIGAQRALKVIAPQLLKSAEAVVRFNREAANASRVSHPNVVQVHDFGETPDGLVFLAMEFVDGPSLASLLQGNQSLPPRRAAAIALQVLDALSAAHELRIVHRDLKPENVMLARRRDGSDLVKVVDFGVARVMEDEAQRVTSTGLVIGTVEYMSPEQFTGEPVDERSDLYSLGILLYRMLAGELPFKSRMSLQAMEARLQGAPRLADVRPEVGWPVGLQDIFDATLCVPVNERYATAAALASDLEAVMLEWIPDNDTATEPWNVRLRGGTSRTPASGTQPATRRARRGDTPATGHAVTVPKSPVAASAEHGRTPPDGGTSASEGTPRVTEPRGAAAMPLARTPAAHEPAPADALRSEGVAVREPARPARSWTRTLAMAGGIVLTLSVVLLVQNARQDGDQVAAAPPASGDTSAGGTPLRPDSLEKTVAAAPDPLTTGGSQTGRPGASATPPPASPAAPAARPERDPAESADVIRQLARIETLTDSLATDDQARLALQLLDGLEPRTRLGRVEAKFRALEANVKLDRKQDVCRLIRELSEEARGTRFAAGVDVFAEVARQECPP
jgi:serine/threonine-protein kinase